MMTYKYTKWDGTWVEFVCYWALIMTWVANILLGLTLLGMAP